MTEVPRLTVAMLRHRLEREGIPGARVMFGGHTREPVTCEAVPQPFGGVRWWLLCPRCKRRRSALYQSSRDLACRRCFRLTYPSQRVDPGTSRLWRLDTVLARLWRRLGGRDDTPKGCWPRRPRGMHEATHARLVAEYERLTGEQWAIVDRSVARLTRQR